MNLSNSASDGAPVGYLTFSCGVGFAFSADINRSNSSGDSSGYGPDEKLDSR